MLLSCSMVSICVPQVRIKFVWAILINLLLLQQHPQFSYASSSSTTTTTSARSLDALLQNYAYRSLHNHQPITGKIYSAELPGNLSGIEISVVRLRSGSLRSRGFKIFNVIHVPAGIKEEPFVKRLALVYHNLGNWSSAYYYPLPGYKFLTPVIGLLVYDATDLSRSTANLPELKIVVRKTPISINFLDFLEQRLSTRETVKCVSFHLNGTYAIEDIKEDNTCVIHDQGHFAVVADWSSFPPPPPPPPKSEIKIWKIIAFTMGGFLGLVLLVVVLVWVKKKHDRKNKKTEMESDSEVYEDLGSTKVGDARLPVASMVRTRPVLEKDDVP